MTFVLKLTENSNKRKVGDPKIISEFCFSNYALPLDFIYDALRYRIGKMCKPRS